MGAKSDLDLSQSASAKLERMLGFGRFQFFQVSFDTIRTTSFPNIFV